LKKKGGERRRNIKGATTSGVCVHGELGIKRSLLSARKGSMTRPYYVVGGTGKKRTRKVPSCRVGRYGVVGKERVVLHSAMDERKRDRFETDKGKEEQERGKGQGPAS